MKIVIISARFSKNFGYSDNLLPKYLARQGHEVHLVTSTMPPYSELKEFEQTYSKFIKEIPEPNTQEHYNGFTIHYLEQTSLMNYPRLKGLIHKIIEIKPDVIQTLQTISWIPSEAVLASLFLKCKIFTENHTHVSVFPLAQKKTKKNKIDYIKNFLTRKLNGILLSFFINRCYAITEDCALVANVFFGISSKKIKIAELGVDTDYFNTVGKNEIRIEKRKKLNIREDEILCIYTGRFTNEKNPFLLAKAVEKISLMNKPYRALFIGDGIQADEIKKCSSCLVLPFMEYQNLNKYYKAADIAIWPTQESMSMLDAAACGLPLVVNNTIFAKNRIEGNGLYYEKNNLDSLIKVLLSLEDQNYRTVLGEKGEIKMKCNHSWQIIASDRLLDYKNL